MSVKEYVMLLKYVSENNSWGYNMLECIERKRKCVKYVHSSFDTRTNEIFELQFDLGAEMYTKFRVSSKDDLQTVYNWLDEEVPCDA